MWPLFFIRLTGRMPGKKTPEARAEAQCMLATHLQPPKAGDKALPLRRRTGRHDAQ